MPGCEEYSTSERVHVDGRRRPEAGDGTQALTDPMREFSQANDLAGQQAPVSEMAGQSIRKG